MSGIARRPLLLGLLSASAFPALACGPAAPPPSAPSSILEAPLPPFSRRAVDGKQVSTREPSGKVVVVKFFAKYCEPCKKTLPAAQKLHANDAELMFIGIAEDEKRADIDEMISTYGLSFPVIHDRDNLLAGRFRVSVLPATFVADTQGRIRWVGGEKQTESDLASAIDWVKSAH
jgi:peroxiredoxin